LKRNCLAIFLLTTALRFASAEIAPDLHSAAPVPAPTRLEFGEVWAYLMDGEERFLDAAQPITDLGYFGAAIGISGRVVGLPSRDRLPPFKGRVHLVIAELGNYALAHFCLDPQLPLRDALLADIAKGAEAFDGVQIDFEAVSSNDYDNFYAFLGLLKTALGGKALSVALPAQVKDGAESPSYERIAQIVDRIVVMAYDEHWSASDPGPVASLDWCKKVAAYSVSKIGGAKLVMGAPFYGRAWADKTLSRAYKYSSLVKLIDEKQIGQVRRQGDIPYMEYAELVNVKVYFDDFASTMARLSLYYSASVRNIAFWRLGQEDPGVWSALGVEAPPPAPGPAPDR
jgi:hypothetical protein